MSDIITDQNDLRLLNLIQNGREGIISKLLAKDNGLPNNKEDRDLLMRAMEGAAGTILAKTKIKSDVSNAQNNANTVKMISEALLRYNPNNNANKPKADLPELDLSNFSPKPGETDQGTLPVTYNEIMNSPDLT